eukprot:1160691-Amphidinium_carterae.1
MHPCHTVAQHCTRTKDCLALNEDVVQGVLANAQAAKPGRAAKPFDVHKKVGLDIKIRTMSSNLSLSKVHVFHRLTVGAAEGRVRSTDQLHHCAGSVRLQEHVQLRLGCSQLLRLGDLHLCLLRLHRLLDRRR